MRRQIITILIAVTGSLIGFGFTFDRAWATAPTFQFEKTPLFTEANIVPGYEVTHWIRATNSDTIPYNIATKANACVDPDHLGDVLKFKIKMGAVTLYEKTLSEFCNETNETFLSVLSPPNTVRYDYSIAFDNSANNNYQGKTLSFDILVGSQQTEGEDGNPQNGTYTFVGGGGTGSAPYNPPLEGQVAGASTSTEETGGTSEIGTGSGSPGGEEVAGEATTTSETETTTNPIIPGAQCVNYWWTLVIGAVALLISFLAKKKSALNWFILIFGLVLSTLAVWASFQYCLPWLFYVIALAVMTMLSLTNLIKK